MRRGLRQIGEEAGHAASFGPSLDDSNFLDCGADEDQKSQIECLPNRRVESRVELEWELEPEATIRLTRRSVLSLMRRRNGDSFCVHHSLCNSRHPRFANDTACLQVPQRVLPIVEWLIAIYPNKIRICDLPGDNANDKMQVAIHLFDAGLIISPMAHGYSVLESEAEEAKKGVKSIVRVDVLIIRQCVKAILMIARIQQ